VIIPSFWCASRPVIPAFALYFWRCVPYPVLGFPTGLYPVGCEGSIHYSPHVPPTRRSLPVPRLWPNRAHVDGHSYTKPHILPSAFVERPVAMATPRRRPLSRPSPSRRRIGLKWCHAPLAQVHPRRHALFPFVQFPPPRVSQCHHDSLSRSAPSGTYNCRQRTWRPWNRASKFPRT